jgi:hypothetical protein
LATASSEGASEELGGSSTVGGGAGAGALAAGGGFWSGTRTTGGGVWARPGPEVAMTKIGAAIRRTAAGALARMG